MNKYDIINIIMLIGMSYVVGFFSACIIFGIIKPLYI
jgi:hypothetical protein